MSFTIASLTPRSAQIVTLTHRFLTDTPYQTTEQDAQYLDVMKKLAMPTTSHGPVIHIRDTPERLPKAQRHRVSSTPSNNVVSSLYKELSISDDSDVSEDALLDSAFDDVMSIFDNTLALRKQARTMVVISCAGCGTVDASGTPENDRKLIQCSECYFWSHESCIEEHWEHIKKKERWLCPCRCDKEVPRWSDDL